MAAKKNNTPRKKAAVAEPARINPAVVMAARNIANMIVVTASSATVLLTLMIARQF